MKFWWDLCKNVVLVISIMFRRLHITFEVLLVQFILKLVKVFTRSCFKVMTFGYYIFSCAILHCLYEAAGTFLSVRFLKNSSYCNNFLKTWWRAVNFNLVRLIYEATNRSRNVGFSSRSYGSFLEKLFFWTTYFSEWLALHTVNTVTTTQQAFSCSKSTVEKLEKGVRYVQS